MDCKLAKSKFLNINFIVSSVVNHHKHFNGSTNSFEKLCVECDNHRPVDPVATAGFHFCSLAHRGNIVSTLGEWFSKYYGNAVYLLQKMMPTVRHIFVYQCRGQLKHTKRSPAAVHQQSQYWVVFAVDRGQELIGQFDRQCYYHLALRWRATFRTCRVGKLTTPFGFHFRYHG